MIDDWSLMEGDKLLVCVARWVNHSCVPNFELYMSGGFKDRECVRLRVIREIKPGEELTNNYNEDFFGENNKFCLCGHVSEHGIEAEGPEDKKTEVVMKPSKRKRTVIPRIKVNARDVRSSLLTNLIKFFSEDSNVSVVSETSSIPLNCDLACEGDDLARFGSPEFNDSSDGVSSTVTSLPSDHFQSTTAPDLFSNHSFNDSGDEIVSYERNDSNGFLHQVSGFSVEKLKASLSAIVSVHNASDALLNDLLKRDQLLFDGRSVSPWAVENHF